MALLSLLNKTALLAAVISVVAFASQGVHSGGNELDNENFWCPNCPMECFVWCVRVPNVTSPCNNARQNLPSNSKCNQLTCVDFYCGSPSPIFCKPDGTIERECLPQPSVFDGVPTSSKCWKWFESQCEGRKNSGIDVIPVETTLTTTAAAVAEPIRTPRPPAPPVRNGCPGCPVECGELCTMTNAIMAPCQPLAWRRSDAALPASSCQSSNCRNSYCYSPHAYFCDDNTQQIDRTCTTDETAWLFLNSTEDVCRNWYTGQCKKKQRLPIIPEHLTPGIPKTTTPLPETVATTAGKPVRPINSLMAVGNEPKPELCEASCPAACGDSCYAIDPDLLMSSPCMAVKGTTPSCADLRCRNFYCNNPLAVFCTADNQVEPGCTSLGANADLFFNSSSVECRNWAMGLCAPRRIKITPPPIEFRPETKEPTSPGPDVTLFPTRPPRPPRFEPCAPDCPAQCGSLCRMVNAIVSPCLPASNNNTCPEERCQDFYCHAPFALFCTDDGRIDEGCSDEMSFSFINSTISECRDWIASQCKKSIKPDEDSVIPKTRTKRETRYAMQPCAPDCPNECGSLCRLTEAFRAPCSPVGNTVVNGECPQSTCQNFYCGAPAPIFCNADGTMDVNCTSHSMSGRIFLDTNNSVCYEWFLKQCYPSNQDKQKQTSPSRNNRPSRPTPSKVVRWHVETTTSFITTAAAVDLTTLAEQTTLVPVASVESINAEEVPAPANEASPSGGATPILP